MHRVELLNCSHPVPPVDGRHGDVCHHSPSTLHPHGAAELPASASRLVTFVATVYPWWTHGASELLASASRSV